MTAAVCGLRIAWLVETLAPGGVYWGTCARMTHTAAFDADDIEAPESAYSDGWLRETIVHASIVTVILALGVALRSSFGFGFVSAIVTSLTVYWGLLLIHALVRRGQDVVSLSADVAELEEENAALRRMSAPGERPKRAPMPAPARPTGGPITPALPGLGAPRVAASGDPTRVLEEPTLGAKAPTARAPERAPEAKSPDVAPRAPAKPVATPPATAAQPQPEPPAKPKAAHSAAQSAPQSPPQPAPASMRPAPGAPTIPGGPKGPPPPLPAARAPFPAAAIALGVAGPDRRTAPDREPIARAANPMSQAAPARAAAAARSRPEPHFDADPPMIDSDEVPGGLVDPRAQDIAIMQSLIKGLADQLNAPTAPPLVRTAATTETSAPELSREAPLAGPVVDFDEVPAATVAAPPAPIHALDTVDGQVGALRNVASALRAPAADLDESDEIDDPADDHGYDRGLLAQIAGAVEAARIDIYLDPILGLDDRKARHFEVSVRLRNDDGELLDPREFGQVMRGTGLGPRIEAHTFTESIQLAGQFAARGADASLFANLSAESLRDGGFHDALAGALTPDVALASRLVMSVAQSEVRSFGPAHWDALAAMAQTGLRYALVDVVDLDVDFEAIKRRGFDFVRLDAQVFLDGLPAPHGEVPAADLCRYLSRLGFSMIVGRIADERQLVKVLGFGALLGQGRLFGAPRPLRVEHVARQPSAA